MRLAFALAVLVVAAGPAVAADTGSAKAHQLSPVAEAAWVKAVQDLKTKDGSSVLQALRYAEKLRPTHFKAGKFSSVYNGADGLPEGIAADYSIGGNSSEEDAFTFTFEVMTIDGEPVAFYAKTPDNSSATEALMSGEDGLVRFIDEQYRVSCVDVNSGLKFC